MSEGGGREGGRERERGREGGRGVYLCKSRNIVSQTFLGCDSRQ